MVQDHCESSSYSDRSEMDFGLQESHLQCMTGKMSRNVQARPKATNTSRNMSKVSDEETMQERIIALKPDAFAARCGVRKNGRVVNAEIDLASDSVGHSQGSCILLGNVIHEAICWVW